MNAPKDYEECSCSMCENLAIEAEIKNEEILWHSFIVGACLFACGVLLLIAGCEGTAHAENSMAEKYCDAIYIIEGGAKTSHPYGILAKYKTTTPRQACINTVNHKYHDWQRSGAESDFVTYLASKYAPLHVKNDPTNLNANWESNLRFYLAKEAR